MTMLRLLLLTLSVSHMALLVDAFAPPSLGVGRIQPTIRTVESLLEASEGKRKRRRRKQPLSTPVPAETVTSTEAIIPTEAISNPEKESLEEVMGTVDVDEEIDIDQIKDIANFEFGGEIGDLEEASTVPTFDEASPAADNTAIPLPDIRGALRKKQMEEELAKIEEEEKSNKPKIDRRDKKALVKLLEQQPYADADDSFFEEEEYTTVSALLGERAKPFLGIPTGPLQVGHFIGALVIVLMAFVEYPGFPLTNLPSPLRGALQGGLATVYLINTVLAVLAVFKAGERGQPAGLWVAKTFSVGGLAYDQLTQLPTVEEIEKAKARKGKRALQNRRK